MGRTGIRIDKPTEKAVCEILKSRARSRIYLYLLRKNGAKTEQIIKGTHLHPSTVRETLSQMHDQHLICRKKLKNDNIGKNPYIYRAIPPIKLLKGYAREIEDRLNKLASLAFSSEDAEKYRPVRIRICERGEEE
ncbi:MAG: TrmB family transcriptional regulator [Candidatus Thermoplasmatota archaeon]|nr:TrmB family transcriptional regulator [Candidatus Thermoplasmatota archaeon]